MQKFPISLRPSLIFLLAGCQLPLHAMNPALDPQDQTIWENTLRHSWQLPIPATERNLGIGIYNRDLVTAGDTALQLAADYYLHRKFYGERTQHVYKCILHDSANLLSWVQQLKNGNKSTMHAFKNYIRSSQQLIAYNPFKKQLIGPLAKTITVSQFSTMLKQHLLSGNFGPNSLRRFQWQGDHLEQIPFPAPFSVVPLLSITGSFLASPMMAVLFAPWFVAKGALSLAADYIGTHHIERCVRSAGQAAANALLPNYPNLVAFLFSKPCAIALQTLFLAYALKFMDHWYDDLWVDYLCKHHKHLEALLIAYEQELEKEKLGSSESNKNQENIKEAKAQLFAFVIEGHKLRSIIPQSSFSTWLEAKTVLIAKPLKLCALAVGGFLAYKGYQWWQAQEA